jgi:hypothetical protein
MYLIFESPSQSLADYYNRSMITNSLSKKSARSAKQASMPLTTKLYCYWSGKPREEEKD